MPYVGSFPEVNVRTYVRAGDRRGVWFMSLDIDRWLPALVARLGYRIPYCVGDVRHVRIGDRVLSSVDRRWPRVSGATAAVSVTVGDPVADDDLSRFLTARWGLLARPFRGRPVWAPVEHPARGHSGPRKRARSTPVLWPRLACRSLLEIRTCCFHRACRSGSARRGYSVRPLAEQLTRSPRLDESLLDHGTDGEDPFGELRGSRVKW